MGRTQFFVTGPHFLSNTHHIYLTNGVQGRSPNHDSNARGDVPQGHFLLKLFIILSPEYGFAEMTLEQNILWIPFNERVLTWFHRQEYLDFISNITLTR